MSNSESKPVDVFAPEHRKNARRLARTGRQLVRELARIREQRGLSRADVAATMGIHRSGVSRFERGESDPRLSTILRYAHAAGAVVHIKVEPVEECEDRERLLPLDRHRIGVWLQDDESDSSATRGEVQWSTGGLSVPVPKVLQR